MMFKEGDRNHTHFNFVLFCYEFFINYNRAIMEQDLFRKKVYMNTLSSTLIHHSSMLLPQWVSQNQLNYLSAYDFASYNIEEQSSQIIARQQGQNQVLACQFRLEVNESNCDVYYLCQSGHNYYLSHLSGSKQTEILLYQNDSHSHQYMVYDYLDFVMMSEGQQQQSSPSIADRTQKLIEQIKQEQVKDSLLNMVQQMEKISQIQIALGGSFGLFVVEMKNKSGVMLVNINKCKKQEQGDFCCPIRPMSLHGSLPELSQQEANAPRIIYLFPDKVVSLKKTKDITRFVLLTQQHLILIKVNYQLMELSLLHKIALGRKETIISIGIVISREEEHVVALTDTPRKVRGKKGLPSFLRMFAIQSKKIVQIREAKREDQIESHIRFQDEVVNNSGKVKFSCKVLCSQYEIQEPEEKPEEQQFGGDVCGGVLMAVLSKMMAQDQNSQKDLIKSKQKLIRQNGDSIETKKSLTKFPSTIFKDILLKENIGGCTSNSDLLIFWQKIDPIIHIYKIVSKKEQEQKHRTDKEDDFSTQSLKHQKQQELKDVYSQLMGIPLEEKEETEVRFLPKLVYLTRIDVGLIQQKIWNLVLSPTNSNILMVSGTENKETVNFHVFQLDLFRQLGNQDPAIFLKPIRNIHKPRSVDLIATSLVKQYTLFLSGKLIHNFDNQILDGALSFDIHPYNFFLAVSSGFSTKIYALEGNQKLTSLFTINGQGMKQVKYSPLGNHLCLLTSKSIKIMDAYSFNTKFVLHEKNSNFTKCFFSSNGLQFYTVNQNHIFSFYNTFDYSKIDSIKSLPHSNDFKPVAIKTYLKISQYCFPLENGGLYVRYKSQAVVISEEQYFSYEDGEKIRCIEIDEKNGVLFVGCRSGKVRAHVWPLKEQSAFECFSEIRTGFSSISSMALSSISPLLYIGNQNGNISKVKYTIDRDKGVGTEKDHNLLLTDRNFRYFSMQGVSIAQRMYRFAITNGSSLSSDEVPEKARLEFKLSQVIQKLNEQMKKLKTNIKEQLQVKSKLSIQKVDFGLLHHMNQMITTKLHRQLREEIEQHKKQIHQFQNAYQTDLAEIMKSHDELIKQKSFKTYENASERTKIKRSMAQQLQKYRKQSQKQISEWLQKNKYVQKLSKQGQEQLFFMPNDEIQQYVQQKIELQKELQKEKQRHYELRKICAIKETAIKQMYAKKIKEQTLEFKIGLERSQMEKKLNYNHGIVNDLKTKIEESEQKVHQIQTQAFVIKTNAQYKKEIRVEEMIDACSYKLWMKDKLEEEEIGELSKYLSAIDEIMESKCQEVIDLLAQKNTHTQNVKEVYEYMEERKRQFNEIKMKVLSSRHKLKEIDIMELFKSSQTVRVRGRPGPRFSSRVGESSVDKLSHCATGDKVKRVQSTRGMLKLKQEVPIYHKLMDKQTNFLKTNVKIHQRKMKKMGKQNGKLLCQFQKLQLQRKYLIERQMTAINSLQKIQHQEIIEQSARNEEKTVKPTLQLSKTSFQRYVELKSQRSKVTLKYKTAASTPCHLATPLDSQEHRWFKMEQ